MKRRSRFSLRARIVFSYALFSALLSAVFAGGVYLAFDRLEDEFVGETVTSELDEFIAATESDGAYSGLVSSHMRIYVSETASWKSLPALFARLEEGVTELEMDGREYHVEVRRTGGRTFVLAFDETDIEARQVKLGKILLAGVLGCTYVGVWAGFAVSRRVIEPVSRLSGEVQALMRNLADRVHIDQYADDEVGGLAQSFQRYQQQLQGFLQREREFTGAISHELRTPLAVIGNNVDVLLADDSLPQRQRDRLLRVRRGVNECAELVQAFLAVARASGRPQGECDPVAVASAVSASVEAQFGVPLALDATEAAAKVAAPAPLLAVIVRNLVNNAIEHGRPPVTLQLRADRIVVHDAGGISPAPGDGRLGMDIVRRLCERLGWRIEIEAGTQGTAVTVRMLH